MQDAVTGAHETSTEFSEEILKEHNIFELSKQAEMKDMMGAYADGQIEMYEKVSQVDDYLFSRMKVAYPLVRFYRQSKTGIESFRCSPRSRWTYERHGRPSFSFSSVRLRVVFDLSLVRGRNVYHK